MSAYDAPHTLEGQQALISENERLTARVKALSCDLETFADEVEVSEDARDAREAHLRRGLQVIVDLPTEYDLLTNASARALWEHARRALETVPE